jgi:hypothetical protein
MYQIHLPDSENVHFTACGDGGRIRMPENEREALIIYIRQGTAEIAYQTLKQTAYAGDVITAAAAVQIAFSADAAYYWMTFGHEQLTLLPPAADLPQAMRALSLERYSPAYALPSLISCSST